MSDITIYLDDDIVSRAAFFAGKAGLTPAQMLSAMLVLAYENEPRTEVRNHVEVPEGIAAEDFFNEVAKIATDRTP